MVSEPLLVDTGFLIALYEVKDPQHEACKELASDLPVGKAYSCWSVITEAAYLLRRYSDARQRLLLAIERGVFVLMPLDAADVAKIREVISQYHDQSVDLADACLVHLGNREGIDTVLTLDRRHFNVFRLDNGKPFRILPEVT